MYEIIKTAFGSRITFGGVFTEEEAQKFAADVARLRAAMPGDRSVILDIRTLVPPEPKVVAIITQTLQSATLSGLQRAAVILNSPVVRGQAIQIAFSAEVINVTRYIDASKFPDWETMSLEWVVNGVEPDVPATTGKIRVTEA